MNKICKFAIEDIKDKDGIYNEEKLIKTLRKLSKRNKGSNNRNKQRLKVNKWHKKIANCRIDFLQKLSTTIINNYSLLMFF